VYDEEKVGNLDAPSEEGLLNTFAAALFPSSDASRIMPIQIPEPAYRDQEPSGGAGGSKRDVLVKFSYPYENPRMGTVSVVVYRGQVTSRSTVVVLRPQIEPIYVPLPADEPVQLNLLYTVAANNATTRFYWPDWDNEIAYNGSVIMYGANNRSPEFQVKAVDEMTTVTWVYPQDNYGTLTVYNKSSAIQALRAAHIAANSKGEGGIGTIANGGNNNINIGPIPQTYQFTPGQYVLTATGQGRNSRSVSTEINFEPGTKYTWIITDGTTDLQIDKAANVVADLDRVIQNWKVRSNVPDADVFLGVESTDANVPSSEQKIGTTNSQGEYSGNLSLSGNLIPKLTYDNAAKVLVKITVAKDGYVSVSQAINALTILEARSDFVPDRFELAKAADKNTPGASFKIALDEGVAPYTGN
jgi:hypothetical protein